MAESDSSPATPPTPAAAPPGDDELKTWVLHEQKVPTIKGATWAVEPISLGKQKQITFLLRDLLAALFETQWIQRGGLDLTDEKATAAFNKLVFDLGLDKLTAAAAILLDKSKEDIDAHLELKTVLDLVIPFLLSTRHQLEVVLKPYWNSLFQAAPTAQAA